MRLAALAAAAAFLLAACSQGANPVASVSPTPRPSPSVAATPSPAASPTPSPPPCTPGSGYGLLIVSGNLQLITTCGTVQASAPLAVSSALLCSPGQQSNSVLEPPVSASNSRVYFRDGDTKIRSLLPTGQTADVTTVPGGPRTVSFFSVSPDDQRIAVVVEDLSAADTIGLRLYVEDLNGGGHHADLYNTTTPKSGGDTLWPMGWHQGALALVAVTACAQDPSQVLPSAWHVVSASTGDRLATIPSVHPAVDFGPCVPSRWPSPAGVACIDFSYHSTIYDWAGHNAALYEMGETAVGAQSAVSPSGGRFFISSPTRSGYPGAYTRVLVKASASLQTPYLWASEGTGVKDQLACGWIDEDHLLAPTSVIAIEADAPLAPGQTELPSFVTALPSSGVCAGRFPGGL